jgi:hypothetical protein
MAHLLPCLDARLLIESEDSSAREGRAVGAGSYILTVMAAI